ncbi:hypothetical protein NPIL_40241 [Nephila pilipes]|uniref:Uncharacterized protein n=1 Tax=Nephila pilipes TaxID=299642 RepID=A0A8X6Q288_NEPPI|nr:hypothetical protein NPIL_40241 [Nephila pilipes]
MIYVLSAHQRALLRRSCVNGLSSLGWLPCGTVRRYSWVSDSIGIRRELVFAETVLKIAVESINRTDSVADRSYGDFV